MLNGELAAAEAAGKAVARTPKGSAECCDPNAEHCAKCGKIKGSPGCCK